jgi:hypothetical protein
LSEPELLKSGYYFALLLHAGHPETVESDLTRRVSLSEAHLVTPAWPGMGEVSWPHTVRRGDHQAAQPGGLWVGWAPSAQSASDPV